MCIWQGSMPQSPDLGAAQEKTIEWALAHAGATLQNQNEALISEDMRNAVLHKYTDYMWIDRDGSGFCTACLQYVSARHGHGPHRSWERCPECGKSVEVRHLRYSHKKLREEFYAVEWRKSVLQHDAVVMIGSFCELDSTGADPRMARKRITPMQLIVFRYGKGSARFQRCVYNWGTPTGNEPWHMIRNVSRIGTRYFGHRADVVVSQDNFFRTITGTPFASAWEAMEDLMPVCADHCEELDAIARRPWLEYMAKAGFEQIARDAMGTTPKGALNTRRRTVREILRLNPDRYAELKGRHADISMAELQVLQAAEKGGCKIRLEEAAHIADHNWYETSRLLNEYGPMDRPLVRFLMKADWNRIRTLTDYLDAARAVGIDLTAPEAKLPRNLEEAHDRAVQLRNDMLQEQRRAEQEQRRAEQEQRRAEQEQRRAEQEQRREGMQKRLDKRLPELEKKYCFAHNGLVLRPARQLTELIDEGNALRHCVGGYTQRYADGLTDICFLRKESDPDTPWRTIEFSAASGKLVQDRGYNNDRKVGEYSKTTMTPELRAQLDEFWAAYWAWRNKQKERATA